MAKPLKQYQAYMDESFKFQRAWLYMTYCGSKELSLNNKGPWTDLCEIPAVLG